MKYEARGMKQEAGSMKHEARSSCFLHHASCFMLLTSYFLLFSFSAFALSGKSASDIPKLEMAVKPWSPPQVTVVTLKAGAQGYLLPDHELPLFQIKVLIPAGAVYEPIAGLASVLAEAIEEGGTRGFSRDEKTRILDRTSSSISVSVDREVMTAQLSGLVEFKDEVIPLFMSLLFEPRLERKVVKLAKDHLIESIKREEDSLSLISSREFRKLIYGESNPWGRWPTASGVSAIKRKDLEDFHGRFFNPDRIIFAAAGDFGADDIAKQLDGLLGRYRPSSGPLPALPTVEQTFKSASVHYQKESTQSAVSIGHLGSTRFNEDKYPLVVMNYLLGAGGAFSSRLASSIRVKKGLAYEVFSDYTFGPETAPGIFVVHLKAGPMSQDKAAKLVVDEIKRLRGSGISASELSSAKRAILTGLVFEYDSSFKIVSQMARFHYFGYPDDYIEEFRKKIAKVGVADVNRVARKYLHPEGLKVLVVGGSVTSNQ